MLHKKDYIKFADMVAKQKAHVLNTYSDGHFSNGALHVLSSIKIDLVTMFTSDNPNFDSTRFNAYIDKRVQELTKG